MCDEIYRAAKSANIMDVISGYIQVRKKGRDYEALCPFHNDKHLGAFKIDVKRNRFRCFACGEAGDPIDFVAKIEGISPLAAAKKIMGEEAEENASCKFVPKTLLGGYVKREAEYLNKVYSSFVLSCPPLSEEHKKHLLEVRRVPTEVFFEWPKSDSDEFWSKFKENLKKREIKFTASSFIGVPGFFYNYETGETLFSDYQGIGIILFDEHGWISGLQIRQDKASGKNSRYKLFSSGYCDKAYLDDELGFGSSIGQVPDISVPGGELSGFAITEGKFKALKLAERGMVTLSLNGVQNQEPAKQLIDLALSQAAEKIYIAFDSDMDSNDAVAEAAKTLAGKIKSAGLKPLFFKWDPKYGKGIDDYFNNPNAQGLNVKTFKQVFEKAGK